MIALAEAKLTSCSVERPPKMTPTRTLLPFGAAISCVSLSQGGEQSGSLVRRIFLQ
jgi:hypothetical protein